MNEHSYAIGNAVANPWGDLAASQENVYAEFTSPNSAAAAVGDNTRNNHGESASQSMQPDFQGGEFERQRQPGICLDSFSGKVDSNFGADVNVASRASVQRVCDEMNGLKSSSMSTVAKYHHAVPLRQWIKQTMQGTAKSDNSPRIGALSSSYLNASIKVAIFLTKQISKAEELTRYGISNKLDMLPVGEAADWAEYTTVFLRDDTMSEKSDDDREDEWQPWPFVSANGRSISNEPDMNDRVVAFLKSFEVTDSDEHQSTKQNSCDKTNAPSSDEIWAEYTTLREDTVSKKSNCDKEDAWQPLPFASAKGRSISNEPDMNDQVVAFLKSFGVMDYDEYQSTHQNAIDKTDSPSSDESKNFDLPKPLVLPTRGPDYFCIHSAEIKCPECHTRDNEDRDKLHRLYHLGLVFYELFSGDRPPQNLCALASYSGAFISLPTLTLVKGNDDLDDHIIESSEPKRRHSITEHGKSIGLCNLSFEYLKLMSIPGPICHLIYNMLDCVYGDFSGNESYTNITDIASDLQLMLEKPLLLRGVNMEKQPSSGLPLENFVVSRDQDIQSVLSCYQKCLAGSREVVIITGESGVGKSFLAQCIASSIISEGGLFLMGKFDAMQQSRPFSALASVLDQYCDLLACQLDSSWANAVISRLQSTLGNDLSHLVKVLPKLSNIVNQKASCSSSDIGSDFGNPVQRIQYLLCQFVDVISSTAPVSVTLCLDDVQWADEASISVLNRVLSQANNSKFFFLACCRDDEMTRKHPFWSMIETAQCSGAVATTFELNTVGEDVLSTALSDLLCLPPRLVKPLSRIVYSKTKGNLLFITQLLRSLNQDGLLRVDLSNRRWVWDEEKILSSKLRDNVAMCFTDGITKLPIEVQLALQTLSMFGVSAKRNTIRTIENQMNVNVSEHLKVAVREGLISDIKDSYQFNHDRIQETCYKMIQEHARLDDHLTYGRCLVQSAVQTDDNDLLFTAINQINLAGPSAISDLQEYCTMAHYNLVAGKKAMEMSDFTLAYSLFQRGISFARAQENHWIENYALSLELFNLSSKSALSTGDFHGLKGTTDEVMKHARCFEDETDAHFILMLAMMYTSKIPEALKKGIEVVTRLGESIPINPSQQELHAQVKHTQLMIKGKSEQDILNHRVMTDARKLIIFKFFSALQSVSFLIKPNLHHFIVLQMVQMTMTYGVSPASPVALACFGSLLAKLGNIRVGHQFVLLASSLSDKIGVPAQEYKGELICVISRVKSFTEPIQAIVELQSQGAKASLLVGDVHWHGLNLFYHSLNFFWVGSKLTAVKDKLSSTMAYMKGQKYRTGLGFINVVLRTVMLLSGEADSNVTNELTRIVHESKTQRLLRHLSFHNMYISFMLGNDDLKELSETFCDLDQRSSNHYLMFGESVQGFIAGLIFFRLYRETGDTVWAERGNRRLSDLLSWEKKGCEWNFRHKRLLLLSEQHYSNKEFDAAKECYGSAISSAEEHKFLNDAALAHELYGIFLLETGDLQTSLDHFRLAHEKCSEWGAVGKANQLFQYISDKFSPLMGNGNL